MDTTTKTETEIQAMYDASRAAYAAGDTEKASALWADAQLARLGPPEEVLVYDSSRGGGYSADLEAAQHRADSIEED